MSDCGEIDEAMKCLQDTNTVIFHPLIIDHQPSLGYGSAGHSHFPITHGEPDFRKSAIARASAPVRFARTRMWWTMTSHCALLYMTGERML